MYTVKELARLTGLTPRTLRYYDSIGLLSPARRENDYRLYGPEDVGRLQQILLYREMGLPLEEIRQVLDAPGFDRQRCLGGITRASFPPVGAEARSRRLNRRRPQHTGRNRRRNNNE